MAYLVSEVEERNQNILILVQDPSRVADALKRAFNSPGTELFVSAHPPQRLDQFDYIFTVNSDHTEDLILSHVKTLIVAIYAGQSVPAPVRDAIDRRGKNGTRKLVELSADYVSSNDLDRIFWFAFSKSAEHTLAFVTSVPRELLYSRPRPSIAIKNMLVSLLKPKRIVISLTISAVFLIMLPVPYLYLSSRHSQQELRKIPNRSGRSVSESTEESGYIHRIASALYHTVRPVYLLFSLAGVPDDIIAMHSQISQFVRSRDSARDLISTTSQSLVPALPGNIPPVTDTVLDTLESTLKTLNDDAFQLRNKTDSGLFKAPELARYFESIKTHTDKAGTIVRIMKQLPSDNAEIRYLLLIVNDADLRPGGGIIDAYGILKIKNRAVTDIEILNTNTDTLIPSETTEVPSILARHMGIEKLSVADAAYSAHFPDNVARIKLMLEGTVGPLDTRGAILLTRSSIARLLTATGPVSIEGSDTPISGDNFSVYADLNSSTRLFYQRLFESMRKKLTVSEHAVAAVSALMQSLDEKQIIVLSDEPAIESALESLYWTGRIITPRCVTDSANCIVDSLFPVETNVGNNAINPFVIKYTKLRTIIRSDGGVADSVEVKLRNTATSLPSSSTYKAYFQLLLPPDITITSITRNNVLVEDIDTLVSQLTILGTYIELKPHNETVLRVNYQFNKKLDLADGIYQVILQKQPGSANSELSFELTLPHNLEAARYNFAPVVNGAKLIYNTVLDADKVFLVEFRKR